MRAVLAIAAVLSSANAGCKHDPPDPSPSPPPGPATIPAAPALPPPPAAVPKLVARVDLAEHAQDCQGRASLVYAGLDRDGDGKLSDGERHEPPMVFCTADPLSTNVIAVPPNAYCEHPGWVVAIDHGTARSELEVCLDADARSIQATYAVYQTH